MNPGKELIRTARNIFNSLAFRIGFAIIAIEVVIFILIGAYYINHFSTRFEKSVETRLKVPAQLINQGVLSFEAIEDEEIMAEIIGGEITNGFIVGLNHRIFYSLNPEFKGRLVEEIEELSLPADFLDYSIRESMIIRETSPEGSFLHIFSPLFTIGGKIPRFFFHMTLDSSWIEKEKQQLVVSFFLSSMLGIFTTSILIFLFFRSLILSKLTDLTYASRSIKDGVFDITIRQNIMKSPDEIGSLARSFVAMAEELQRSTTSIDNLNAEIRYRKKAETLLRKAEENYRILFDSAIDAIFVINSENYMIQDCNVAATHLTGLSKNEMINHRCSQICSAEKLDNEDSSDVPDVLQKAIDARLELQITTKTGDTRDVELRARFLEVKNETVILAIFRDISEIKHAAQEQQRLTNELNQARRLESLGTLAAGIAHEINTPIQFISDNVQFIQDESSTIFRLIDKYKAILQECDANNLSSSEALARATQFEEEFDIAYIREEFPSTFSQTLHGIDRVRAIVIAMKNFSHMGRDVKSATDINESINNTIEITRSEWKYIAEIEKELAPDLPLVNCYPADINQVFMNLIVNACHAIREKDSDKKQSGKITITTQHSEQSVTIKIHDTGCGIPEDIRDKIFDPFFTTREIGKGTGQGLSLAYQTIVDKHNGTIGFETDVDQGTTFVVSLPIK